ncbi:hypothetical protein RFI_35195 [Reticulomyxa filosa]|uniref:Uncharacterized protein n=1 Tax=Reticulomyxa filosa TaxID=46433 RepID=X6LJV0_RETFI|nr:hypothetical protein RFI_35195 [Reticulomyxa filosa]|eukprot:ETO02243.1 hypothetical protein RFI_35195 [Reticulomyxa filosa]
MSLKSFITKKYVTEWMGTVEKIMNDKMCQFCLFLLSVNNEAGMGCNDKQIYSGDPFVKEYLNENAFIDCKLSEQELRMVSDCQDKVEEMLYDKIYNITHKSLEECAHYVWTVDINDTLYKQYLKVLTTQSNYHSVCVAH